MIAFFIDKPLLISHHCFLQNNTAQFECHKFCSHSTLDNHPKFQREISVHYLDNFHSIFSRTRYFCLVFRYHCFLNNLVFYSFDSGSPDTLCNQILDSTIVCGISSPKNFHGHVIGRLILCRIHKQRVCNESFYFLSARQSKDPSK